MAQIPATITGNLTGEVYLKELPGGSRVARFRVAASRSYRDQFNNWVSTDHLFITVDCWNQLADNAKKSLEKGMPIIAVGTLLTNEWEDRDGAAQQQILLRANHLGLDMTRYVVSSMRSGGGKAVEGVPAPDASRPEADEVIAPRGSDADVAPGDAAPAGPLDGDDAELGREPGGDDHRPGADAQDGELVGAGAGMSEASAGQGDGGGPPF